MRGDSTCAPLCGGLYLLERAFLEIEVIEGSHLGFERLPSKGETICSRICFFLPHDSEVYTLRALVSEISRYNRKLGELILDPKTGRLKGNTMIVLNGTHVDLLRGPETPIKAGDRLVLVPFVDGG